MAFAKAAVTFRASASNAATATTTGGTIDLRAVQGPVLCCAKITNGATGPTVACDFVVQVSQDNFTTTYELFRATAGVANNGIYQFAVELSPAVMYARVVFTGNTGQAVTVESYGQSLSTYS